jgi:glyoxylase-like metal-dependent hydrolase (beta-lactamase superfamily II)
VRDGDDVAGLRAMATPGHTDESFCYQLGDRAVFTGDTLFLASIGRPDLEAPDDTRRRAEALHASLQRLLALPPDTLVLPCHASAPVPFDGKPLAARVEDVKPRVPLAALPRDAFVREVLARIPPTPPNHRRIVQLNEAGAPLPGDPAELEAGANRCSIL